MVEIIPKTQEFNPNFMTRDDQLRLARQFEMEWEQILGMEEYRARQQACNLLKTIRDVIHVQFVDDDILEAMLELEGVMLYFIDGGEARSWSVQGAASPCVAKYLH